MKEDARALTTMGKGDKKKAASAAQAAELLVQHAGKSSPGYAYEHAVHMKFLVECNTAKSNAMLGLNVGNLIKPQNSLSGLVLCLKW